MTHTIPVNQNLVEMEYAVRGAIPRRAMEMQRAGRTIYACNLGNPQALGQKPITFYRQVLTLLEAAGNIDRERSLARVAAANHQLFNESGVEPLSNYIIDYSANFLEQCRTGMGAYTESSGPLFIRDAIARFIDRRDGENIAADPEHIFLTDGASDAAKRILELLITGRQDGVMIPIPQYPLYSATVKRCGGSQVNYYPDEDSGWSLTPEILEEAYRKATADGIHVKCIVVINPGNPTGAILDKPSIDGVVNFAEQHGLAIIADEVYQDNLYGGTFISMASAVGARDIPLFSLHSISKGFAGECGHRGGYMELRNMPHVEGTGMNLTNLILKQASVSLCSNTVGQAIIYMLVNPPEKDSPPYGNYQEEKNSVLRELESKAALIKESFKQMEGMQCFGRTGAMYLFPRLNTLPSGGNDFDYCMALLEETGICTVNGAGFGQLSGTKHMRIAFLPPRETVTGFLPEWIRFHNRYVHRPQV
jgi:aspartate/methionine/tyrosine aminotransferase